MILSASRRTDIPCYYADWFYNRIREGFVYVRNPMNWHQVSEISLSPDIVDCIVFWTKNPAPMLDRLDELKAYSYYFQFTLTGYGTDVEEGVPHKKDIVIPTFQQLSDKIGRQKVIWRYDPIIFTEKYTPEYHLRAFAQIAGALQGYTDKCVISFVDRYAKIEKNLRFLRMYDMSEAQLMDFAAKLSEIAGANDMEIGSCAEQIDLEYCGIRHNCCIDKKLIESILGCEIDVRRDKNQRETCGCVESIDIGTYNTCQNGCIYCYANYSQASVAKNCGQFDSESPLLCGKVMEGDKVTLRQVRSVKEG